VLFWAWVISFPADAAARMPSANQRLEHLEQQFGQLNAELAVVKDDHDRLITLSKSIAELEAAKNDTTEHDRLLVQSKGLADLEKRLEDNHQSSISSRATFENLIILFGVLFTALVIYFSWRAVNEAKVTAQLAAREEVKTWTGNNGEAEVKKWIGKNGIVLQQVLKKMQLQGEKMLTDIIQQGDKTLELIAAQAPVKINPESPSQPQHEQGRGNSIRERRSNVVDTKIRENVILASPVKVESATMKAPGNKSDEDGTEALLNRLNASEGPRGKAVEQGDQLALQHAASLLREKPEAQYTFNDWRVLYFEAANREAWSLATRYIDGMTQSAVGDWQDATAKSSRAWLLHELKQHAGAVKQWDEVIKQYGASDNPRLIKRVAAALVGKGYALGRQGLWSAEIAAFDQAFGYGEELDSDIAEQLAKALTGKGDELSSQGRWIESIAAYDEAIMRYQSYSETPIAAQLARAMLNKGYVLFRQSQWSAALAMYDQVVLAYGARPEASIKALAVRALAGKGYVLSQQGQNEAAIAAYGEAGIVYGSCREAVVAVQVAKALTSKGYALGQQGHLQAALATYDDVVSGYGDYRETNIAEQVAKALFYKGSILSQQRQWTSALRVYNELERRYGGYSEAGIVKLATKAKSNHAFAMSQLP
jgi:tetratricopeptide (TPR) repeat protein